MQGKRYAEDNKGLDSDYAIALIDTFKASGIKPKIVAKKLGVKIGTIYNTLTLSRKYVPSLVMTNNMTDIFEEHKAGSKIFFGLRIAGVPYGSAYKMAFSDEIRESFSFEEIAIPEDSEKDQLTHLVSEMLPKIYLEELVPKISNDKILELIICCIKDYPKVINRLIESLEIENVAEFLFACSSKEGLNDYIKNQDVNPINMTNLALTCLEAGADARLIGANIDSHSFGSIAVGFSTSRRVKPDLKQTDLKTLQEEDSMVKMSRKRKSIQA